MKRILTFLLVLIGLNFMVYGQTSDFRSLETLMNSKEFILLDSLAGIITDDHFSYDLARDFLLESGLEYSTSLKQLADPETEYSCSKEEMREFFDTNSAQLYYYYPTYIIGDLQDRALGKLTGKKLGGRSFDLNSLEFPQTCKDINFMDTDLKNNQSVQIVHFEGNSYILDPYKTTYSFSPGTAPGIPLEKTTILTMYYGAAYYDFSRVIFIISKLENTLLLAGEAFLTAEEIIEKKCKDAGRAEDLIRILKVKKALAEMNETELAGFLTKNIANEALIKEFILQSEGKCIHYKNSRNANLLTEAVLANNTRLIDALMKENPELDFKDENGNNLLLISVQKGNTSMVGSLLEQGFDVNYKNKDQSTALMAAIDNSSYVMVNLLLKSGAEVEVVNSTGDSPLMLSLKKYDAARYPDNKSEKNIVYLILNSGQEITNPDQYFSKPLIYSIENRLVSSVIRSLFANGADISIVNNYWKDKTLYTSKYIKKVLKEEKAKIKIKAK